MKKLLTTGVVALSMAVGMVAYAAHSFTDVPDDHLFHNEIAWMKDNDITRGCNPPSNTLYCPDDFVTRGQMAAFLYRFSNAMPGGEQGPPGPPGEDGHVGNVLHNSFGADIPANSHGLVAATCAGTDDMVLGAEEGPPGDSVPTYPIGGDAPNGPAEGYIAVGGGMSVGTGS